MHLISLEFEKISDVQFFYDQIKDLIEKIEEDKKELFLDLEHQIFRGLHDCDEDCDN